jgi:thiol-disulfide isomerase/thioredoxin
MPASRTRLARLPVLVLILAGLCGTAPGQEQREPAATAPAPALKLEVGGWDRVERFVAANKGRVVVVDVWTTTCPTCCERFPEVVALERRFGPERVAVASVACDYDGIKDKPPAFYRPGVEKFLREHRATGWHLLLDVPFADFLEQRKLASTPAVYVFDPRGTLSKRFDNDEAATAADEFTTNDVAQRIESLLADGLAPQRKTPNPK